MSKKLLIPITIIAATLLVVIYINQGFFSLGWNYIRYRYLSEERETTEFKEVKENPFTKYMDDIPDLSLNQPSNNEEDSETSALDTPGSESENNITDTEKNDTFRQLTEHDSTSDDNTEVVEYPTAKIPSDEKEALTIAQISSKYMDEFTEMEVRFKNDLESIVASAISDYNGKEHDKLNLADIYLQKGESLEVESDKKFYRLLSELEKDLMDNSHSTEMVKEVEEYYKQFKRYEKNRILDRGMALLED
ncbi:MAG: hypothetical protein ACQEP4_09795 [Bacillota bacterium]